jgi:hypothetical protein
LFSTRSSNAARPGRLQILGAELAFAVQVPVQKIAAETVERERERSERDLAKL